MHLIKNNSFFKKVYASPHKKCEVHCAQYVIKKRVPWTLKNAIDDFMFLKTLQTHLFVSLNQQQNIAVSLLK